MIQVILQRAKCIGCSYCVDKAPQYFRMSKKDGKTVLLESVEKAGFHRLKIAGLHDIESLKDAALVCPVKIIQVMSKA